MIVVFPMIPWGFLWQRPQQLITRLAKRGFTVIYLAPTDDGNLCIPGIEGAECESPISSSFIAENVFHLWCQISKRFDIHYQPIPQKEQTTLVQQILTLLESGQPQEPIYFVQHPGWTPLVNALHAERPGKIVYDCMDDHQGFNDVPPEAVQDETLLLSNADLVLASSQLLQQKAEEVSKNVILLRNGTDFETFSQCKPGTELAYFKGKTVIGYYGSIRDWFDFDLLHFLAEQRKDYEFVIIGDHSKAPLERYESLSHVHFLGEKKYEELPGYLAAFDVCIIPFQRCPLTLATNPVKFYEFLSCGKPVVSVRLPELEHYEDLCYLADTKAEFLEQVDQAVEETKDPAHASREKRIAAARENSWDERAAALDEALEAVRPLSSKGEALQRAFRGEKRLLAKLTRTAMTRLGNETEQVAQDYQAEITRICEERDQFLRDKDASWQAEVERVAGDYKAEISRIGSERDQMLADKDKDWSAEIERVSQDYRNEITRLSLDQQELLKQTKEAWAEDVRRIKNHYERFFLVRTLTRSEALLRSVREKLSKGSDEDKGAD